VFATTSSRGLLPDLTSHAGPANHGAMSENLEVRQGAADDLPIILGLIDEAAGWLLAKNTDQWREPWPSREARDNRVLSGLQSGNTWLVTSGDTAVATITYRQHARRKQDVNQLQDGIRELWTEAEQSEPAVYVSRLVVRRQYSGLDIGGALTDWAGLRGARGWSAQWIRIDVWTTNEALHNYYAKRGFEFCRTCPFDKKTYPSAALFQKPTSSADAAAAARFAEGPSTSPSLTGRPAVQSRTATAPPASLAAAV
jgi:GNAT superfamily N-acetyltransferase